MTNISITTISLLALSLVTTLTLTVAILALVKVALTSGCSCYILFLLYNKHCYRSCNSLSYMLCLGLIQFLPSIYFPSFFFFPLFRSIPSSFSPIQPLHRSKQKCPFLRFNSLDFFYQLFIILILVIIIIHIVIEK